VLVNILATRYVRSSKLLLDTSPPPSVKKHSANSFARSFLIEITCICRKRVKDSNCEKFLQIVHYTLRQVLLVVCSLTAEMEISTGIRRVAEWLLMRDG